MGARPEHRQATPRQGKPRAARATAGRDAANIEAEQMEYFVGCIISWSLLGRYWPMMQGFGMLRWTGS